ncbi:hypothetical protein [Natrarchaeobaculum aegyptiacum]|uniref:hypothetical protein n=1 Tax=Natrarchaeobaculum aegyptiacum TaxID=745377 RepID=UPI0012601EB4|nr:hypothetical protein [Natrarchaeobaculum aegyptiacum]
MEKEPIPDRELHRLLQVALVFETIIENRVQHYHENHASEPETQVLKETQEECREHRERLIDLLETLGFCRESHVELAATVSSRYSHCDPTEVEALRDQLASEIAAYIFYSRVLQRLSSTEYGGDADLGEVIDVLEPIKEEEKQGVMEILAIFSTSQSVPASLD